MAKKISQKAAEHFFSARPIKLGGKFERFYRIEVKVTGNYVRLYLYGNEIARRNIYDDVNNFLFTLSGWNSRTTRERLSALGVKIRSRKHYPYIQVDNKLYPIDPYVTYSYAAKSELFVQFFDSTLNVLKTREERIEFYKNEPQALTKRYKRSKLKEDFAWQKDEFIHKLFVTE